MNPIQNSMKELPTADEIDLDDNFLNIKSKLQLFYNRSENSDSIFQEIKQYISHKEDIDLSNYREKFLHRRLYFRLIRLNLKSYLDYLQFIKKTPRETATFIETISIHVTEFFRDVTPFRYLEKELFKKISQMKCNERDKTIRILSAPCSTGEETYSIAIITEFLNRKHIILNPVEIFACDIDQKVLDFAIKGIYQQETLKHISSDSLMRNFIRLKPDTYQIKPHFKDHIQFFTQDLMKPNNFKNFDLIICRNFMIYISKANQELIIHNIIQSLKPNSFLMLGKSEGFPLLSAKLFTPESLKEHIYQFNL